MNLNPLAAEEQFLNPLDRVNGFDIRPGLYEINGATSFGSCVNFTIHSQNAVSCAAVSQRGKRALRDDSFSGKLQDRAGIFDDRVRSGYLRF